MEIVFFIAGIIIIMVLSGIIIYRISELRFEQKYYSTLLFLYGIELLIALYLFWGRNLLREEVYPYICFGLSLLLLSMQITFIWEHISVNRFEFRLLLLLPLCVIEVLQILYALKEVNIGTITNSYIWELILSICVLSSNIYFFRYIRKLKIVEKQYRNSLQEVQFFSNNLHNRFGLSRKSNENLDDFVTKLYNIGQVEKVTPSLVNDLIHSCDLSKEIRNRVFERLFETNLYRDVFQRNFTDFSAILFPEIYRNHVHTTLSSGFENRTYEVVLSEIRRFIKNEQVEQENLKQKIDVLIEMLSVENKGNKSDVLEETKSKSNDSTLSNQALIRELFHTIFTPLSTIQLGCVWLLDQSENMNEKQIKKIENISKNVELISAILTGYRELTSLIPSLAGKMEISQTKYIETIFDTMKEQSKKEIYFNKDALPERMGNYSTNIITILLVPLIQNACEAAPEKTTVSLKYNETDDNCIIEIENQCIQMPKGRNLNIDGYSSKDNHSGEGIRSVRRIAESIGISFDIKAYNNKKKVVAKLVLAKK